MPLTARQRTLQQWSAQTLGQLGVSVRWAPWTPPPSAGLVVCNHVSWLDCLVLGARLPACFVAKQELFAWPLMGGILRAAGAIALDRSSPIALADVLSQSVDRIRRGHLVAVFPEGITTDGTAVSAFHPGLFEAAIATRTPVLAIGLRYGRHGGVCVDAQWAQESFLAAYLRVMSMRRDLVVEVASELIQPEAGEARQALALRAERAVARLARATRPERSNKAVAMPGRVAEPSPPGDAKPPDPALRCRLLGALRAALPENSPGRGLDDSGLGRATWEQLAVDSLDALPVLLAIEEVLGMPLPDHRLGLLAPQSSVADLLQAVVVPNVVEAVGTGVMTAAS